jgi:hypothetical protein
LCTSLLIWISEPVLADSSMVSTEGPVVTTSAHLDFKIVIPPAVGLNAQSTVSPELPGNDSRIAVTANPDWFMASAGVDANISSRCRLDTTRNRIDCVAVSP